MTRDEGGVLVLVLIVTVVLALVVVGMANYTTTILRYGQVSETRADRLSAADGAMRDALEKLRLSRSLCATALADGSGGYGTTFPEPINGATAAVTCERVGVEMDAVQAWAVVVTGEGVTGSTGSFTASQGGGVVKKIGGPVFVHDPARIDFAVPVQLVEGDVFYTDPVCPADTSFTARAATIAGLSFEPADTRGTICTRRTWQDIFGTGPTLPDLTESASFPLRVATDYTETGSCRVFSPGIYSQMPALASRGGSYFRSGAYLFRDVAFVVDQVSQIVTAGAPDSSANVSQAIPNPDCDAARDADAEATVAAGGALGATFYLDGTSRIDVQKGGVEILGARRGRSWVAVQALDTNTLSATSAPIVSTASGENKEFTSRGMLWAPRGSVELGNITNRSAVQLHGGALVAKLHIGANASINSYVIEVPSSALTQTLLFTSRATKGGVTSIRATVEYRAPREVAVKSWRIVN